MIIPDLRCEVCGTPYSFSRKASGYMTRYCSECRRRKSGRRRKNDPTRCMNGHPKTRRNWRPRFLGGRYAGSYCYACRLAWLERRKMAACKAA